MTVRDVVAYVATAARTKAVDWHRNVVRVKTKSGPAEAADVEIDDSDESIAERRAKDRAAQRRIVAKRKAAPGLPRPIEWPSLDHETIRLAAEIGEDPDAVRITNDGLSEIDVAVKFRKAQRAKLAEDERRGGAIAELLRDLAAWEAQVYHLEWAIEAHRRIQQIVRLARRPRRRDCGTPKMLEAVDLLHAQSVALAELGDLDNAVTQGTCREVAAAAGRYMAALQQAYPDAPLGGGGPKGWPPRRALARWVHDEWRVKLGDIAAVLVACVPRYAALIRGPRRKESARHRRAVPS